MMDQTPKVSIIIPAWNGMTYIKDCLNSLMTQDYPDFEVIVVDDASSDGTANWIAEHFPKVTLIRNKRNLGFSGGVNKGLRVATGDPLVLLNQDTVVQTGWLRALVETLLVDSSIGIIGCKALYLNGSIQHAGGYVDERGESSHCGRWQGIVEEYDRARDVDFVTGAALAITRAAFEVIGELDEGFSPAYYEDVDWCYRVREAGFRVVYAPKATLIHKEASSAATQGHDGMYLFHRNRLRFVLKHWPLDRLTDEFVQAEQAWLEGLGEGGESLIAAMHHAYLHHLLYLGDIITWRRRLLGTTLDEADILADVLLALRTVIPLRSDRIDEQGEARGDWTQLLGELQQRWDILRQPDFPNIPVLRSLVGAVRFVWDRVFAWSAIKRQIEFNIRLVAVLERLEDNQRRLNEYTVENGREVAELAKEMQLVRRLRETWTEED